VLHQEKWRADVHGEEIVEVLDPGVFDARCLGDAGVDHQDVEPVADNRADPLGQNVRTLRLPQVGTDLLGAAAGLGDFGDDGVGLLLARAVVDQHLRAGLCQNQGAGAADAARAPVTRAVFPERLLMILIAPWIRNGRRYAVVLGHEVREVESYSDRKSETWRTKRSGYWYCEPWLASG